MKFLEAGVYERLLLKPAGVSNWLIIFTVQKVSKYGVFSGPYFPSNGLNTERYKVFSPNMGKCGPEETPYLDTFHAVFSIKIYSFTC